MNWRHPYQMSERNSPERKQFEDRKRKIEEVTEVLLGMKSGVFTLRELFFIGETVHDTLQREFCRTFESAECAFYSKQRLNYLNNIHNRIRITERRRFA